MWKTASADMVCTDKLLHIENYNKLQLYILKQSLSHLANMFDNNQNF